MEWRLGVGITLIVLPMMFLITFLADQVVGSPGRGEERNG